MQMNVQFRFGYGRTVPWVRRRTFGVSAIAGPDEVLLRTEVPLRGEGFTTRAEFTVHAGDALSFVLHWRPSHRNRIIHQEPEDLLRDCDAMWRA